MLRLSMPRRTSLMQKRNSSSSTEESTRLSRPPRAISSEMALASSFGMPDLIVVSMA
jgi:hypothetical protein